MWVLARSSNQTRPNRVGDDVAGSSPYILILAQCPVIKARLPDVPALNAFTVKRAAASRLEGTHEIAQAGWPQFDQPMQMIRHQDPSQRAAAPFMITKAQLLDYRPRKQEFPEQRKAIARDGG